MPRAGEAELDIGDEGITVLANAAARRPLLERLAWALEFDLDAPDVGDEPITVNAVGVELHELLPLLFPDRPYRVAYRFDPVLRLHLAERLEVGLLGTLRAPGDDAPEAPPTEPAEEPVATAAEPGERLPAPKGTPVAEWEATLDQLEDADFTRRVEAIESIEPKGSGLALLVSALARDEHPKVRAAAAEQLEDSETRVAADALIAALQDPDKEVVLAAIDALEFSDDETVANEIRPLEQHGDKEIREAAAEAVCFILDCDE